MSEEKQGADMSPEAVWQRLREVGQLYRLGLVLMRGRLVERVKEVQAREEREERGERGERGETIAKGEVSDGER